MRISRLAAVFTALMLVLLSMSPLSFAADYQQQLDELSAKYDNLEKQQKEIQTQINKTKSEKDKQLAAKTSWITRYTRCGSRYRF